MVVAVVIRQGRIRFKPASTVVFRISSSILASGSGTAPPGRWPSRCCRLPRSRRAQGTYPHRDAEFTGGPEEVAHSGPEEGKIQEPGLRIEPHHDESARPCDRNG